MYLFFKTFTICYLPNAIHFLHLESDSYLPVSLRRWAGRQSSARVDYIASAPVLIENENTALVHKYRLKTVINQRYRCLTLRAKAIDLLSLANQLVAR